MTSVSIVILQPVETLLVKFIESSWLLLGNGYDKYPCWPLLSNQCFYKQIAGYGMGVGDHRVYRLIMKGGHGLFDHASHATN